MGTIQIQTPLIIQVDDYHDFHHMLDVLNLSPHLLEWSADSAVGGWLVQGRKPELALFKGKDYFYEGKYHAIIYLPGVDDEAAAKLAAEIEASLEKGD